MRSDDDKEEESHNDDSDDDDKNDDYDVRIRGGGPSLSESCKNCFCVTDEMLLLLGNGNLQLAALCSAFAIKCSALKCFALQCRLGAALLPTMVATLKQSVANHRPNHLGCRQKGGVRKVWT